MVRLVSGGSKNKSKKRYLSKKQRKANKEFVIHWISITDLKNAVGLTLPDLKRILSKQGLWSGRRISSDAMYSGCARYNRGRGIYEWNKEKIILMIQTSHHR